MPSESQATTRDIRVTVRAQFVPERSDPEDGEWFFAYRVLLENRGDETVRLVSRHWIITDGEGEVHEVRGPGVVGEQPVLDPQGTFSYVSACPLTTPFGTMHGTYQMVNGDGDEFEAQIAPFSLAAPGVLQ
jgi:ApaG protein